MHTEPRQNGPRLEALLDARDHLRIKLSLADERPDQDATEIYRMREELSQIEREISTHRKHPQA